MPNELALFLSLFICFGGVLVFFRLFGKDGIFAWIVIATIAANIEVLILVHAFGMDMTLGNILFAATFAATDILSENYGRRTANKAVWLGVATNLAFVIISQSWFLYTPADGDFAMPLISQIFSYTPRLMLASLLGYVLSEVFDVYAYHALWNYTAKKCGDRKKYLWIRNNVATLIAQMINISVFTAVAFWGIYSPLKVLEIGISGYVIYIFTSLADTPFVYLGRALYGRWISKDEGILSGKDASK